MSNSGLAVVETRWWPGMNSTVKSMFDLLSDLHHESQHAYEYEMVGTAAALGEAAKRLAQKRKVDTLYLASHGEKASLSLHSGESVSTAQLAAILADANADKRYGITGVYLGACLIGSEKVAQQLFRLAPKVDWVAGYQSSVDWGESSAIDMLFFNQWLNLDGTARQRVRYVARYFAKNLVNLCSRRGVRFSIFARGRDGVPIDLLRPTDQ